MKLSCDLDTAQVNKSTSNVSFKEEAVLEPSVIPTATVPSLPSAGNETSSASSTPLTVFSPISASCRTKRNKRNKRKREEEDEVFAKFLKKTTADVNTLTRVVTDRIAESQIPIKRYFSILAQEVVDANVPLSVQRAIFQSCQKLTHSILQKYELQEN